ncbi:MAG: 50S ribosomal protein L30e [Candidatus Lokiarchaeota archaeon]|nr:50S ribosomal protein L30e [Candidatus Lokiarchaeota archaeon]
MPKRGKSRSYQKAKRKRRTAKKKQFDVNKLINIAVKTGKTIIGTERLKKYITKESLELIILANNCPEEIRMSIELMNSSMEEKIEVFNYPFSSWELGAAAGKPFMIASMGLIDPGDSTLIQDLDKARKVVAPPT